MKKILLIFISITMLLLCASCGTSESAYPSQNSVSPDISAPVETAGTGRNEAAISLKQFEDEIKAGHLGEISRTKDDSGYDAALAASEDGTNYIYMYLLSEEMAASILKDGDGDGQTDNDLSLTLKKDSYQLYTQESSPDSSSESSSYGRYLLAGSMIIIVNGPLENKELIKENADTFMRNLGFDVE